MAAIKTVKEVVRERSNELASAALQQFWDAVKPIYGATETGRPDHIGSALLLDLTEGRFLATAAHVIDWNQQTSLYLGAEDFALLQFEALVTTAPNGDRNKDHADFAVAPLDSDLVSRLSGAKFITEAEISRSVAPSAGRSYTCLGYPNSKNKFNPREGSNVTPRLLPYTSVGRPASCLPKVAKDRYHVLLEYDAKHFRDENGKKVSATALRGCSGGAMIDLGRISADTLTDSVEPKLAALLIEGHAPEKVILGTRIDAMLDAVRAHFRNISGEAGPKFSSPADS